jgi:hypothetical protein
MQPPGSGRLELLCRLLLLQVSLREGDNPLVIYPAHEQAVFGQGEDARFLPVVVHREEPCRNTGRFALRNKQRGSDSLVSDRHLDEINGLSAPLLGSQPHDLIIPQPSPPFQACVAVSARWWGVRRL